jgi:hypothetical protein
MLRDASQDNPDARLGDLEQAAAFFKADYGEFGYALGNRLLALASELRDLRSALGDDPPEPRIVLNRSACCNVPMQFGAAGEIICPKCGRRRR